MKCLRSAVALACAFGLGARAPAAAPATPPAPTPAPLRARIALPSRQVWDVELLGRFHPDRILLRRVGAAGTIEIPVADIQQYQVPLAINGDEVLDQYAAGRYAEVAAALGTALQPYLPYIMEAPSNLDVPLRTWVKARYWQGDTAGALAACETILSRTSAGLVHAEATAIAVLCRIQAGQLEQAGPAADTLAVSDPYLPAASPCGYALAALRLAERNLPAAQEALARLVCFRSRDTEWMPPALLLSAEAYARAGQADVAAEVLEEIRLTYPGSRWAAQAARLDLDALAGDPP